MYDHIPNGSQIYLQMPGDHVVTGVLREIGYRIPPWVIPSPIRNNYHEHVYIRMPNGVGLSSKLNETLHRENDFTVHGFRCYIPLPHNVILTAFLEPYNYDLHFSSAPRIFLRIPFQNQRIYTGILHRGYRFSDNIVH